MDLMKKTYEILGEMLKLNPSITHLCLRLYESKTGLAATHDDAFRYEWISTDLASDVSEISALISEFEKEGWTVGLASMVMTTEGIMHLLMLDYLVAPSANAEGDLAWKLSTFNQSGDVNYRMDGYLIRTKNSYHYLSKYITTEANFINFLGSALLFRHSEEGESHIVDDIWLGRSIKRRFGTIRLGKKEGIYPTVASEVK
ncbi:MAG: hypothetical protein JWO73_308 [Candidatus Taylorbacteria bacterium]|nr:hypothetical protein [Candidatus Taylorbacteria bacterium]